MTEYPNLLIIDSLVQEIDIVRNSVLSNNEYLIVDSTTDSEQTILDFINNKQYNSVAYMSHTQQPDQHKIFSDYTFNLTLESDKQKLADFWNNFNTQIVDYLGCFFYSNNDWVNGFNYLENNTGKQFRSSSNNTGHLAVGGDWILESDNVNIKDLYFTDDIDLWFQTLGKTFTSVQDGSWGTSGTWDKSGVPDLNNWPNDAVIIQHTVSYGSLTVAGNPSSIGIKNGGSLVITNTLNVTSGRLWVESGGSLSGNNIYLNTSNNNYLNGIITTTNDLDIDGHYTGSPTISVGRNLLLGAQSKNIHLTTLNLDVIGNMVVQNAFLKYDEGFINVGGDFTLMGTGKIYIPTSGPLNVGGNLKVNNGTVIEGYNPDTGDYGSGVGGIVSWVGSISFSGNNNGLNNCSGIYSSPWNLATCSPATAPEPEPEPELEPTSEPEPEPTSENEPASEPEPQGDPPTATGCFTSEAKVETDQGIVELRKLNENTNTINQKELRGISKCKYSLDKLIVIEKDAFGENQPSEKTIVSPFHIFVINNESKPIADFINKKSVYVQEYNNELLYCPIFEEEEKIKVNNLLVHSLNPHTLLARMFDKKTSCEETRRIGDFLNNYHEKLKKKPNRKLEDYRM